MGLIKKLIGGFLSFLGSIFSIFNIFKKSEYFLEADAPASTAPSAPAQPAPEKVEVKQVAPKPAAESNGKVAKPEATVAAATPVISAPKAPEKPATPPALFAPNNTITSTTAARRRPGPSMNRFIDMARQVKA